MKTSCAALFARWTVTATGSRRSSTRFSSSTAYRSEVIDAALAVQSELSTGARYIRCILSSIESNRPPEFGSFGAQARALQPAQERYRYASLLRKAGRQAEADRFMPKSEEDSFLLQYGTLIQHPANRAALSGRLGEYLGCPAND
jgi:hypothetical protein